LGKETSRKGDVWERVKIKRRRQEKWNRPLLGMKETKGWENKCINNGREKGGGLGFLEGACRSIGEGESEKKDGDVGGGEERG